MRKEIPAYDLKPGALVQLNLARVTRIVQQDSIKRTWHYNEFGREPNSPRARIVLWGLVITNTLCAEAESARRAHWGYHIFMQTPEGFKMFEVPAQQTFTVLAHHHE